MPRWTPQTDARTGRTMRSGLNLAPRVQHIRPRLGIYRAIILQTYATDNPARLENRPNTTRLFEIECDIVLARSLVPYLRVPVLQRDHGVSDSDLWIPRPSTRVIGGGALNLQRVTARGTLASMPPNLEDLDGDQVLVQFLEGDIEKPIIVGAVSHAKTKRLVIEGDGWSEAAGGAERGKPHLRERYMRYRGVEARINDRGDVLLDTVGATADQDTEAAADSGGQIRFRVKGTERFTVEMAGIDVLEVWKDAQGVHIDLGEGATEQIIRGNRMTTWLLAHQHPTAVGASGPPVETAGGVSLAAGDHLSELHKVV